MDARFRFAAREDLSLVFAFIKDLAAYEKMTEEVVATEALLEEWLFEKKIAEVLFVMKEEKEVGFALFFHNFSTFVGKGGLYLEDLFVKPAYRGQGFGNALFQKLASIALERGCGRFEWCCLNWNTPSIAFYLSMGAKPMDEWTTYRLDGGSAYRPCL